MSIGVAAEGKAVECGECGCDGDARFALKGVGCRFFLFKEGGVTRPRESSTWSKTSPSRSPLLCRLNTQGFSMDLDIPRTSRWS